MGDLDDRLAPYLPTMLRGAVPAQPSPACWTVPGSLVMFDISGFTRLTDRLASRGRAGAEELSDILDDVFGPVVEAGLAEGCDLLKWGGDAVMMLAVGPGSALAAARAASLMRAALGRVGHLRTSVGPVLLRASSGVATGQVHLVLAGDPAVHRELMVLGPVGTRTTAVEAAAAPGQVLLDGPTAAALPARLVGEPVGPGRVLRGLPAPWAAPAGGGKGGDGGKGGKAGGTGGGGGDGPPGRPGPQTDRAHLVPAYLRSYVATGAHEPEHRVAAAAFVRFSGTDGLLEDEGPAALATAVDDLVRTIQDATLRHGVSFHETDVDRDGGKVMLIAGAPQSTGDDVDHLLAAVRMVVDRPHRLPVRVGVAQGRVFTGELGPAVRRTYSVKGGALNLAARLAARAEPGTVVVPLDLLQHSRTEWALGPTTAMGLKGLAQPVRTATLGAATGRPVGRSETAMVGRSAELARLTAALERLGDGSGGVVTVVGQPGMGKTRLVTEVVAGAADFHVLVAECGHSGTSAPYATVRILVAQALGLTTDLSPAEALARAVAVVGPTHAHLLGELPTLGLVLGAPPDGPPDSPSAAAPPDEFRTEALHRLVLSVLEAALADPTLLVVEDAHLMDGDSARVLARVAGRCAELPWLLLTTRREHDPQVTGEAEVVELGPLDPEASEVLTDLVAPDHPLPPTTARALAARAGGHPLFLRELVLATSRGDRLDDLPLSVEELVAVQVDALPPRQRSLLRRAAVLGDSFTLTLLAALVEPDAAPSLREDVAELSAFLEPAGGRRWRFRHAVHRETAYAGLPMRVRTRLHAQVGEVLSRSSRVRQGRPEVLAHHFFAAGRYADAWRCARTAGVKANAAAAPEAAAHAYAQAVEAGLRSGTVDARERALDLDAWGDALFLCGRSGEADRAYAQARRLWADVPLSAAAVVLKAAKVAQRQGRHPVALRRTAVGLRLVDGTTDPAALAVRARLLARRSVVLMSQGRYVEAGRCAAQAVTAAEDAGQDDALAQAHLVLHGVEVFTGSTSAVDHGETALRLYEALGDVSGQAHAHNNIAMRQLLRGRWSEARDGFRRAARDFDTVGDAANAANAAYNSADLLNRQGRPEEALELLSGVLRIARAVGDEELRALVLREQGRAHHRAGRPAQATPVLAEARAAFVALHEPHEVCETDIAVAEGHLLAGDLGQALAASRQALDAVRRLGAATLLPSVLRVRASAQLELGDLAGARASLAEGLAAGSAPELAHEQGFLLAVRARLELVEGASAAPDDPAGTAAVAEESLRRLGVVAAPLPWLRAAAQG